MRIERVQNQRLWKRYSLRRSEMRETHGFQGEREQQLFHGTDKLTLEAIVNEGFDIRVSNAGSLGAGKYSHLSFLLPCCLWPQFTFWNVLSAAHVFMLLLQHHLSAFIVMYRALTSVLTRTAAAGELLGAGF